MSVSSRRAFTAAALISAMEFLPRFQSIDDVKPAGSPDADSNTPSRVCDAMIWQAGAQPALGNRAPIDPNDIRAMRRGPTLSNRRNRPRFVLDRTGRLGRQLATTA